MCTSTVRDSGADLVFRLEKRDGTLIEEGFVNSSTIPTGTSASDHVWITYEFRTPHTLQDGSYNLIQSTMSGTDYNMYPLRDGTTVYDFHANTTFNDSRAEYTNDGVKWKGWSYWNVDDLDDADLQFYFTVVTDLRLAPGELYGNPYEANGLANKTLKDGRSVDFRFRAEETGSIESLRFYNKYNGIRSGYSDGDGSDIMITIRTDDGTSNHWPSSTVLASYRITEPLTAGKFPLVHFPDPISVTEGELYHITFSNDIGSASSDNYVSINMLKTGALETSGPGEPPPAYPDETDLDALLSTDPYPHTTWENSHTPIFEVRYADGSAQGNGIINTWHNEIPNIYINGPDHQVRQTFTADDGSRVVNSVTVRLGRVSGNDDLTMRLEESDGTLIEEGTISASEIPIVDQTGIANGASDHDWLTYQFQAPHTLQDGTSYNLVLSTTSSTRYDIFPLRDGSVNYGFHPDTTFSDGRAEYTDDGVNWKGWLYWGVDDRPDADLQFYFTAATDLTISNDTVLEGSLSGSSVGTVSAVDQDDGETFTYELTDNASGRFAIDSASGEVTVADADLLNPAADTGYSITVRVTDGGGEAYEETFGIHIIWDDSLNAILGTSDGDLLSGTSDDDYLAGGDGNDTLWGYGGNDTLFGGSGSDILDGGSGDDVMIGGIGADTIDAGQGMDLIIYESILDSGDIINGFEAGQDHDMISIDTLLDNLGVATEDRANRIAVENEENVHTLKIDTSGNGLFDLMVATVNVINGEILNVGQDDTEVSYGTM